MEKTREPTISKKNQTRSKDDNKPSKDINPIIFKKSQETAIWYSRLGFRVFPCYGQNTQTLGKMKPAKSPRVFDWQNANYMEGQILAYQKRYPDTLWAIHCDQGFFAVDIDTYNPEFNHTSKEIHKQLDATCKIKQVTLRGGVHYFFRGTYQNTTSKIAPGIDTKGNGGYIILYEIPLKGKYTPEMDTELIALLPKREDLISLIQKASATKQPSKSKVAIKPTTKKKPVLKGKPKKKPVLKGKPKKKATKELKPEDTWPEGKRNNSLYETLRIATIEGDKEKYKHAIKTATKSGLDDQEIANTKDSVEKKFGGQPKNPLFQNVVPPAKTQDVDIAREKKASKDKNIGKNLNKDSYAQIGKVKGRIYVALSKETAEAIHKLTDHCAISTDIKGLKGVISLFKSNHTRCKLILCLDNDGTDINDIHLPKEVKILKPRLPYKKSTCSYHDYIKGYKENALQELLSIQSIRRLNMLNKNKKVKWLVDGYIPKGAITLLVGDKGAGKTTYAISLAVEKIIETGNPALYFSTENDYEVVIINMVRQKIKSMFHNASKEKITERFEYVLDKFHIIDPVETPMTTIPQLKEGLTHIDYIKFSIVILDPIASIILKINDNEAARPFMETLEQMAERSDIPILLTLNRKKNIKETELIDQGMGAGTIASIPRSVLYLKKMKGDDKLSVLFKVACNFGSTDGATLFEYKPGTDSDGKETIGCLDFHSDTNEPRDDIVEKYITSKEGSDQIKTEKDILKDKLEGLFKRFSKMEIKQIRDSILEFKDKSDRTIQRNLKSFGYIVEREGCPPKAYWSK